MMAFRDLLSLMIEGANVTIEAGVCQSPRIVEGWDMAYTLEDVSPAACEARLLLREYSHRINNEFALAISAISIAAKRSATDETRSTLALIEDQLLSYAQVHHVLQMPEHSFKIDAAAYLRELCGAIDRSKLANKGIKLVLAARKFQMNSERCWRLGLIVSELITNAVRHAFDESGGMIRVELRPSRSFVECRVTDNGTSEPNIYPGHGLKIVAALARSLGGTVEQRFGPRGTTSILVFRRTRESVHPCRKLSA
jgi:two-component sensor histidine kinase